MAKAQVRGKVSAQQLPKSLTGIRGFDEITHGGLPKGRPTLLCGNAGCGKTLFGMEFLVRGAVQYNEPGVFMSFEETEPELRKNFSSLGFDLTALIARKKLLIDFVYIERSEIEETGEYDLEGLFVRLGHAIDSIGARRVVLDTLESLFAGLPNPAILRSEIRRLFRWLKEKGVTTVITAEQGEGALTRHGMEEYVSDCVILLDHPVTELIATRRLRIVKYRGSLHGTSEYPFLIDDGGISVLPVTSLGLNYTVTAKRISSGIQRLDAMLGGKGFYRGSSILISGTAGTGKTSIGACFVNEACRRGERCLYFAFEESQDQIVRNMRSIGIDLAPWIKKGLLQFHGVRPTFYGLEMHLATMHNTISKFKPGVVVIDPITNLATVGTLSEVKSALIRLINFLKMKQITALFANLATGSSHLEQTEVGVSSLMDTWLLLRDIESGGERNRGLYVLKSRGMAHSNQIREFLLTDRGIDILDVYLGQAGVLTGSARAAQVAQEKAEEVAQLQETARKKQELERKRRSLTMQIDSLNAEITAAAAELKIISAEENRQLKIASDVRRAMGRLRKADR
jgi:circadian clock protein KaiC